MISVMGHLLSRTNRKNKSTFITKTRKDEITKKIINDPLLAGVYAERVDRRDWHRAIPAAWVPFSGNEGFFTMLS
jgi:hypothetical protein